MTSDATSLERSYGRAPGELRPVDDRAGLRAQRDRLGADLGRRDARDLHRLGRGERAALDGRPAAAAGSPPSTGCCPPRPASASRATSRKGRADGRTVEIQRLIGRSLRGVVDFEALGERTIYVDCDVLQADGGTRCASITGGLVALRLACERLVAERQAAARRRSPAASPRSRPGSSAAMPLLDLDYPEDSTAEVDANVVMTGDGGLVEVQATAERTPLSRAHLDELLALAADGIEHLRGAAGRGRCAAALMARLLLATRNAHKVREFARLSAAASRSTRCPTTSRCRPRTARRSPRTRSARRAPRPRDRAGRDRRRLGDRGDRARRRPGVRSARYAGEHASDGENLAKLLREAPAGSPLAYVCALAYVDPASGEERIFEGRCTGTLAAGRRAARAASATTRRSCPTTACRAARWPS